MYNCKVQHNDIAHTHTHTRVYFREEGGGGQGAFAPPPPQEWLNLWCEFQW